MFEQIAPRYDFLNRLLSFGLDVWWRKRMAHFLPVRSNQHILDLATGTADQILSLFEKSDKVTSGVGVDLAEGMLSIARQKIHRRGFSDVISLKVGDALAIPAGDDAFDVVTISFGIRNLTDIAQALREIYRVLKPGGRLLILEFSLPPHRFIYSLYIFYLRYILPPVGGFVSGDAYAYRYLNQTIETFPYGEALCDLLRAEGLIAVEAHPVTFGVGTIYQGDKPVQRGMNTN